MIIRARVIRVNSTTAITFTIILIVKVYIELHWILHFSDLLTYSIVTPKDKWLSWWEK